MVIFFPEIKLKSLFDNYPIQEQTTKREHDIDKQRRIQKSLLLEIQVKQKIKKQKENQNRSLRKQNLDGIYIGRMPDNSGISPEQPKEKYVYREKQTCKDQGMIGNNVIESRSFKNQIRQKNRHHQYRYVYQNNNPSRQVAQITNIES